MKRYLKDLRSLTTLVTLRLKQVDMNLLSDVGRAAMRTCFAGYLDWKPTEGVSPPTPRRFSGTYSTKRTAYYAITDSGTGEDSGTLAHELMAYACHGVHHEGYFQFWDLSAEGQRSMASRAIAETAEALDAAALLLAFIPIKGVPHPFAVKHGQGKTLVIVFIPLRIGTATVERVLDLRQPHTANAFASTITRLPYFPNNGPLNTFRELLPTMLTQDLGGGHGFHSIVGRALQEAGIPGLIYPSARMDACIEVQNDVVVKSTGWNLVLYGSDALPQELFIDFDPWRQTIGRWQDGPDGLNGSYPGVRLNHIETGPSQGSWSVQGLAAWQEAMFEGSLLRPVVHALDPDLAPWLGLIHSTVFKRSANASQFLEYANAIQGAALGSDEAKDGLRAAFNGSPVDNWIRRFLEACP